MFRTTILATALLSVAACGEDSIDADEFITQYASAYCAHIWYCCNSNERSYNSTASCQQTVQAQVEQLLAFRNASTAYAEYDGEAAQACIDRLQAKACSDSAAVYGCLDKVTQAQHKTGDDCTYSAECASSYCAQASAGKKGYCADVSVPGGNCSGDQRGCTSGTFCSAYKKCEYKKKAGEKCTGPHECESFICHKTQKVCANPLRTPICTGT